VGPRAGLDTCGKFRLYRDSIPGPSNPSPYRVAIPIELSRATEPLVYAHEVSVHGVTSQKFAGCHFCNYGYDSV
jgi:hypothetical protein